MDDKAAKLSALKAFLARAGLDTPLADEVQTQDADGGVYRSKMGPEDEYGFRQYSDPSGKAVWRDREGSSYDDASHSAEEGNRWVRKNQDRPFMKYDPKGNFYTDESGAEMPPDSADTAQSKLDSSPLNQGDSPMRFGNIKVLGVTPREPTVTMGTPKMLSRQPSDLPTSEPVVEAKQGLPPVESNLIPGPPPPPNDWGMKHDVGPSAQIDATPRPFESMAPKDAVMQTVMGNVEKRRQRPQDNELAAAQSNANDGRFLAGAGRQFAEAGDLFLHRKGDYSDYDRAIEDADRPVNQLLQRRKSENDLENQDERRQSREDDGNAGSSKSVVARGIATQLLPRLKDDPNFQNASYESIVKLFPFLKEEIDSQDKAKQRANDLDKARITAESPVHMLNALSRSEGTALRGQEFASKQSGKSLPDLAPREGVIPTDEQTKTVANLKGVHDATRNMADEALKMYQDQGPSWSSWTSDGVVALEQRLARLRDGLNVALRQGKLSNTQYSRFMKLIPEPEGLQAKWQPDRLKIALETLINDNDSEYKDIVHANNYIVKGEDGYDSAAGNSSIPKIKPAEDRTDNPANFRSQLIDKMSGKTSQPSPAAQPARSMPAEAPSLPAKSQVQEPPEPGKFKGNPDSTTVWVTYTDPKTKAQTRKQATLADANRHGWLNDSRFMVSNK
jgi:hypothetical protein